MLYIVRENMMNPNPIHFSIPTDNDAIASSLRLSQSGMNYLDIHLIVNHISIVGVAFITLLLLIAMVSRNIFTQKVALWLMVGCALAALVALLSGKQADHLVKNVADVSKQYLHEHEDVAELSSYTIFLTGGLALLGLLFSKRQVLFRAIVYGVLALGVLCSALFVLTGYLGGQLRHPEIRSDLALHLPLRAIQLSVVGLVILIVLAMILDVFV